MTAKRSRIFQIVKATGYSIATVSRALNEETAHMVREATREKVRNTARKLNYIPDRMARSLKTRRANTFGFLMNFETDTISGYVHEVLNGVLAGLKGTGYDLKIVSSEGHATLEGVIRMHGLDGLILPYGYAHEFPKLADEIACHSRPLWPVVIINDYNPRNHVNQLYSDNHLASRLLTKYLVDKGYKRFFFIGCGIDSPDSAARKKGFLEVLKSRGIRFDADRDTANGHFTEQGGYEAARGLLQKRPGYRGAIVSLNDGMALGAIRAIGEAGLKCPDGVAVAGFDGIASGEFSNPPLTTIKFELHEMGKAAVGMLKDIVTGKQKKLIKRKYTFKLIERRSC